MAGGPLASVARALGPQPAHVARALAAVPAAPFLPPGFAAAAGADAPLPFFEREGAVAITPSPRVLALLLQLLELGEGAPRVLVVGAESGYLAALARAAGAARVRLVEPDREVAEAAGAMLAASGREDGIDVRSGPPARAAAEGAPWDRLLLLDPRRALAPGLAAALADGGFAVALRHTAEAGFEVVRTVKAGDALGELRAPGLPLPAAARAPDAPSFLPPAMRTGLQGLLAVEEMAHNVWRGAAPTHPEAEVRRAVEETWRRPPSEAPLQGAAAAARGLALRVFHLGLLVQAAGDPPRAADLYERSHALHPSAEARTFLGWVRALEGRLDEAMRLCEEAIAVDPGLGNPYNDLGAYHLQQGRPAEALPWLARALAAPRYEARWFPYLNMARAHVALGDLDAARRALGEALALRPGYPPAEELLDRLGRGAGAGRAGRR